MPRHCWPRPRPPWRLPLAWAEAPAVDPTVQAAPPARRHRPRRWRWRLGRRHLHPHARRQPLRRRQPPPRATPAAPTGAQATPSTSSTATNTSAMDMPALPGLLGLEVVRHYNSSYSRAYVPPGLLGRGWLLSYEARLYDHPPTCRSCRPTAPASSSASWRQPVRQRAAGQRHRAAGYKGTENRPARNGTTPGNGWTVPELRFNRGAPDRIGRLGRTGPPGLQRQRAIACSRSPTRRAAACACTTPNLRARAASPACRPSTPVGSHRLPPRQRGARQHPAPGQAERQPRAGQPPVGRWPSPGPAPLPL